MKSCKGCRFYGHQTRRCSLLAIETTPWNCCRSHEDKPPR
jgi:hypothetical protein